MKSNIIINVLMIISIRALKQQDYQDFPEMQYMNLSVDPCDDFFEYSCGNFKNVYPLTDGEATVDHFTLLEEELIKLTSLILSEPKYTDDPEALNKSKLAYRACIDLNKLNRMKNPEVTIIKEENGFPLVESKHIQDTTNYTIFDIADAVSKYGIPMLFNAQAYGNPENASDNLIYISQLDDANLAPSQIRPNHVKSIEALIEEAFSELVQGANDDNLSPFDIFLRKLSFKIRTAVHSSLSDDEVIENIKVVRNFTRGVFNEGDIGNDTAATFPGDHEYYVSLKELNAWTKDQFNDTLNLDWVIFMQRLFANSGVRITENTNILRMAGLENLLYGMLNMVRSNQDHVLKSYVMLRLFTHLSLESDAESRQYIEEYFTSLNVTIFPRWKYCTRKLLDLVGTASISFATAYEYQLRHFNVNHLKNALQLLQDLQNAFMESLQNTSWMDESSKKNATKKLENMITILGHPDVSDIKEDLDKFYKNLRISKRDNYRNSIRLKAFKNAYQTSQLRQRERQFWEKSPFEVNAYYNRPNNKMIFPIAMLHPIFFGNNISVLDYGRIGSIIGHEMTHGFDRSGMCYDVDGVINPWWSTETKKEYSNRSNCFVEEYNSFYEPEIQAYVNGMTTLNENIADNGGARKAYRAMKIMMERKNITTGTENFTPEQLFFIGFGTMWCNNPSIDYLKRMQSEKHCRCKFRVNGVVSNMEEFSEAFHCPAGSNMNPTNKCQLL